MHALDRALLALNMAFPESSARVADWVVGRRNLALLELHCSLFGPALQAWAICESCEEKMEFTINANSLIQQNPGSAGDEETVLFNGQSFRIPTSRDLAAAARQRSSEAGALRLMELCAVDGNSPVQWTTEEIAQVGEKMALADPLAEVRLALACPACRNESTETIEITSFLWAEIEGFAKRLLWEIHAIASVYGWTESEVLALSAVRRARYVEMAQI